VSSLRDIKQRIKNVKSTEQIIKAMDLVASTKLQRVRAQLEGARPIYYELKRITEEVGSLQSAQSHVFFRDQEVKNTLYIIITSDRGLSGSYNANITAKALEHMNQGKNEMLFFIGAKGYEFFKKKNKNIIRTVVDVADAQVYYGAERVAHWVIDHYLSGKVQEVFLAYTRFKTVLNHEPLVERLLPLEKNTVSLPSGYGRKYEPDIHAFIDQLVPLYLHMNLFRAFSESHTSEQAARMVNMDAAGKNATEIIEDLTHLYNRKRQAMITQELSEIVGSTNILNIR
jgi:F-type H+-transporting ATPase subunit gamma